MYKFTYSNAILTNVIKNTPFKLPKRTKMNILEECGEDQRPCEEMPHRPKTGILILHPGEASRKEDIKQFLYRVSKDKTFKYAMPSITSVTGLRTCHEVCEQYQAIGGYSPLLKIASKLGYKVEKQLDKDLRAFAPFKSIVGYRYASPLVTKALKEFQVDDIKHLVLLSLEPHYYCQKTGPCYDGIYKYYKKHKLPKWSWTVIDRWPLTYFLCGVIAQSIQYEFDLLSKDRKKKALILFVANGVRKEDIRKGDMYLYEVGATVHNVMRVINYSNDFCLTWLSPPSCEDNLRPSLEDALIRAHKDGRRTFIVVPVSYACECLDTLYEIDIKILKKYRDRWGCDTVIARSHAPNDHSFMASAVVQVITTALKHESRGSAKFLLQCHGCTLNTCKNNKKFYEKLLKR